VKFLCIYECERVGALFLLLSHFAPPSALTFFLCLSLLSVWQLFLPHAHSHAPLCNQRTPFFSHFFNFGAVMDISIGSSSSSSSYRSDSSDSAVRRTYLHHHRHMHQSDSTHIAAEDAGEQAWLQEGEAQPLKVAALHARLDGVATQSAAHPDHDRQDGGVGKLLRETRVDDIQPADDPYVASSAPSTGAPQHSKEAFCTLPSCDSISPRYTPSNSMPYNPSFTTSSVPPPPLPPSPEAMGLTSTATFRLVAPRYVDVTAPTTMTTVSPGKEERQRDDDGAIYLWAAAHPADPSTPPPSPPKQSTNATSRSSAFARTESPSPLKNAAANAAATADAGTNANVEEEPRVTAGAAHITSDETTSATSDRHYQPLHIPALKSLMGHTGQSSSEADLTSGEVRGLSETSESMGERGHHNPAASAGLAALTERRASNGGTTAASSLPLRSAPPAPRSAAATSETTSTAPPLPSRLPSRSVDSAHSRSRPRAAEPRRSLGRAGEDAAAHSEERHWCQDDSERGESVSVTDFGVRPPSHAPTMDLNGRDVGGTDAPLEKGDVVSWRYEGISTSYHRSCSKSNRTSRNSSRGSSSNDDGGAHEEARSASARRAVENQNQQQPPPRNQECRSLSPSSTPASVLTASSSMLSPSAGVPSHSHGRRDGSEGTAGSLATSSGMSNVKGTRRRSGSASDGHAEAEVTGAPVASAAGSPHEEEEAAVSSVALTTPAETTLSSNTGGHAPPQHHPHHGDDDNNGGSPNSSQLNRAAGGASSSRSRFMNESPPPLPPAPWRGVVTATNAKAGSVDEHAGQPQSPPQSADADASLDQSRAAKMKGDGQEMSALHRWRRGSMDVEDKDDQSSAVVAIPRGETAERADRGGVAVSSLPHTSIYKGGVDFVRWVPASIGRDSDLAGASLSPPRLPREVRTAPRSDVADAASQLLNRSRGAGVAGGSARVVAVPLVPSPHRLPQRSASTSAVLAEVAQRCASTSPVPGCVTVSPKKRMGAGAVSSVTRQRMRLTTITSPQLTRDANRSERAYVNGCEGGTTAHDTSRPHTAAVVAVDEFNNAEHHGVYLRGGHRSYGPPVDAWTEQRSGCFLSSVTTTMSSNQRRTPLFSLSSEADRSVVGFDEKERETVSSHGGHRMRSDLDVALASRSTRMGSFVSAYGEAESELGDESSDVPAVVRAWRPLSAVVNSTLLQPRRTPPSRAEGNASSDKDTPMIRWTEAATGAVGAATTTGALSIDFIDSTQPSSVLSVAPTAATPTEERKPVLHSQADTLPAQHLSHPGGNTVVTPGYMAIYGPRTLATRVLQARDALLAGTGAPAAGPHSTCGPDEALCTLTEDVSRHTGRAPPAPAVPYSSQPSRVVGPVSCGSRVMPAIGAAVSVAAAVDARRRASLLMSSPPPPPPPPPCVRVDLSRTPLRGPSAAEALQDSYDDTFAVATYTSDQPLSKQRQTLVGALARNQGEKVAAAMAAEPWSLFLERDSAYMEAADLTVTRDAWTAGALQPLQGKKVARRIPFGLSSGAAPVDEESYLESSRDQAALRNVHVECSSGLPSGVSCDTSRVAVSHDRCDPHHFFEGSDGRKWSHGASTHHRSALEELRRMDDGVMAAGRDAAVSSSPHANHTQPLVQSLSRQQPLPLQGTRGDRTLSVVSASSSSSTSTTTLHQHSVPSRPGHRRSTSTAEPNRPSTASTAEGEREQARLRALTERNLRQTHIVAQQRLMQEEGFRRRQVVMEEDHAFSVELTELNYRRAVTYVQHAAQWTVATAPTESQQQEERVRSAASHGPADHDAAPGQFAGLSAVRQDQAAMAVSLGQLSRELDSMSL
jgi:hypothetical protein